MTKFIIWLPFKWKLVGSNGLKPFLAIEGGSNFEGGVCFTIFLLILHVPDFS